jgi:REP element-mobilizing transposase RayT
VAHPLVIAYHIMWTAYGTWLPNDPRGSTSQTLRSDSLAELGEIHFGRKRVQPPRSDLRRFYARAAELLKHPVLRFNDEERSLISEAFGHVVDQERYTCYACAVMPDHVHILIRKHKHTAEEMAQKLMRASRNELRACDRCPSGHPIWTAGDGWNVFLEHPDDVRRVIGYIERNPIKIRLPAQTWPFVILYDNWPLHLGHSPNSPYAKRLRELGRYP